MDPIQIQPSDVFHRVLIIESAISVMMWMIGVMCLLLVIDQIAKFMIFHRASSLFNRTERLLKATEVHGRITDDRAEMLARKIDKVPDHAVQKIRQEVLPTIPTAQPPLPPEIPPSLRIGIVTTILATAGGISVANVYTVNQEPSRIITMPTSSSDVLPQFAAHLEKARTLQCNRNYLGAVSEYEVARSHGASAAQTMPSQIECLIYAEQYGRAMDLLNTLPQECKNSGVAYHLTGVWYERQNQIPQAIQQYQAGQAKSFRSSALSLRRLGGRQPSQSS